jgi:glycosyltransferase involved in cell wall biosynthesis
VPSGRSAPLRVLTIASELPPVRSGVARSAGRVAADLAARGHTVETLSAADAWRQHLGEFRVSALGSRFVRLERLIASFDVVHLHGPAPFIADALLGRWRLRPPRTTKLVYTHGFTLEVPQFPRASSMYNRMYGPLLRAADAVTVTTPSYAEMVRQLTSRPVVPIPWGVDTPALSSRDRPYRGDRHLQILFVGQQRPYKGLEQLVDSLVGLVGVHATIVGGGPGLRALRERIRRHNIANVEHLGPVDDARLADALAAADCIVLPSLNRSEAFGLALLEGMASGCVPIASDLPGVRDVVGDTGLLVRPGSVTDLRRAFSSLAKDPALVQRLSASAKRRALSYSWDATVSQFEALFEELVTA